MTLRSPRFVASRQLRNIAANQATLGEGARGRAVHLVQQALLDLGYKMPPSTGGIYSPDGIFGDETLARLKEFQARHGLKDDGVLGHRTLARLLPGYQHRVRLHSQGSARLRRPCRQPAGGDRRRRSIALGHGA